MGELIDLALISESRRVLLKLLDKNGIGWFMSPKRLMAIEKTRVDMVVKTAVKSCERKHKREMRGAVVEYCRKQVRRELIRRVAEEMVSTGW